MYSVTEEKLWRWADGVVEGQKPRVATIDSLTATLYNGRQAKADRCAIAMERRRMVVGESFSMGNWRELVALVDEMDKESSKLLKCDFDLVLREKKAAAQLASQQLHRSAVRRVPGVVTAIQEDGLAAVVMAERSATGVAMGIKDRWRCREEACRNHLLTCWVRSVAGRLDRFEDHYPVNGNIIASWARAVERSECTIDEPSDDIRLSILMARDRASAEKKRRRRKTSPTSSNSSIEGLTKAILAGHLAQMRATKQCQHRVYEQPLRERRMWRDFISTRPELHQHTVNFFIYWRQAMPHFGAEIELIRRTVFRDGLYDINMLMDKEDGTTLECWVDIFKMAPFMLSHLRRKAHAWREDYTGLTQKNFNNIQRYRNDTRLQHETPKAEGEREAFSKVSGNRVRSPSQNSTTQLQQSARGSRKAEE